MPNDNQPSALRSLGVGALIGGLGAALVACLAGCSPSEDRAADRVKTALVNPPLPPASPVILAVESQRSSRAEVATATLGNSPTNLTVRTAQPASLTAPEAILKRGLLYMAWNRSPSPEVTGYRLYYGTNSGVHFAMANVGNATNATLTGLDEGTEYFIVATAYNSNGTESIQSNEASGVTPVYVSLRQHTWLVGSYGVAGKTNLMQISTNLTTWQNIHEWVGHGNAVSVIHTNRTMSWFRVEVR